MGANEVNNSPYCLNKTKQKQVRFWSKEVLKGKKKIVLRILAVLKFGLIQNLLLVYGRIEEWLLNILYFYNKTNFTRNFYYLKP